ncbi:MAG: hypothetical protein FJ139_10655 [Deltaproteobacteria bacterium]|nr:hypothetical protein [Deltaproteobacteria bacterium]
MSSLHIQRFILPVFAFFFFVSTAGAATNIAVYNESGKKLYFYNQAKIGKKYQWWKELKDGKKILVGADNAFRIGEYPGLIVWTKDAHSHDKCGGGKWRIDYGTYDREDGDKDKEGHICMDIPPGHVGCIALTVQKNKKVKIGQDKSEKSCWVAAVGTVADWSTTEYNRAKNMAGDLIEDIVDAFQPPKPCGGENQRPCFFWEEIPSCKSGLAENFVTNKCVKSSNPFLDGTKYLLTRMGSYKEACLRDTNLYTFTKALTDVGNNARKNPQKVGKCMGGAKSGTACIETCAGAMQAGFTCGPCDIPKKFLDAIEMGEWVVSALQQDSALKLKVDPTKLAHQLKDKFLSIECTNPPSHKGYKVADKKRNAKWYKGGPVLCKQGEFWDPIHEGECWKCPGDTNRTAWWPVNSQKACEKQNYSTIVAMCAMANFVGVMPDPEDACMLRILSGESMTRIMQKTGLNLPFAKMCEGAGSVMYDFASAAAVSQVKDQIFTKLDNTSLGRAIKKVSAKGGTSRLSSSETMIIKKIASIAHYVKQLEPVWGPAAETFVDATKDEIRLQCSDLTRK